MVRTLPVIPTNGSGAREFQPIWHEDFAAAIAAAAEREDLRCRSLDLGGAELTSQGDLVRRFSELTGREVVQAPVPATVASWGLRALGAIGVDVPFTGEQLDMLADGNVVPPGSANALTEVFGIVPTRLDDGLRRLVDEQPAQLPSEGRGTASRKRYWVDIRGSQYDADQLFAHLREHLSELLPATVRVKPDSDGAPILVEADDRAAAARRRPSAGRRDGRPTHVLDHGRRSPDRWSGATADVQRRWGRSLRDSGL
jgi:NADH dehydrogenase